MVSNFVFRDFLCVRMWEPQPLSALCVCVCVFLDSVFFCLLSLIRVCLLVFLSYFIIKIINACLYPKEREREEKGI